MLFILIRAYSNVGSQTVFSSSTIVHVQEASRVDSGVSRMLKFLYARMDG